MTVKIRKKVTRLRGSHTHGWGSKKKHRGAGNRGGRGMAGSGKRAAQKKTLILKMYGKSYFGKKGFIKHNRIKIYSVNIAYIEEHFNSLLEKGIIKKENGSYAINIKDLNADKLLGKGGTLTKKFKITAKYASKNAEEKIKKMGGELVVDKKPARESS